LGSDEGLSHPERAEGEVKDLIEEAAKTMDSIAFDLSGVF
jgi:hypothetical protein